MKIITDENHIYIEITDERFSGTHWITKALSESQPITVSKAFSVKRDDITEIKDYHHSEDSVIIEIGDITEDGYWKITKRIIETDYQLYLFSEIRWERKHFVAEKGVSIFPKLNRISRTSIWIGGGHEMAIPFQKYDTTIRKLPSYIELQRYVEARLEGIIREFIDVGSESQKRYEKILNNRIGLIRDIATIPGTLIRAESAKYQFLINRIQDMLEESLSFREQEWQIEIAKVVKLIFPKYITVLQKIQITNNSGQRREIDIGLLDVNGNIDIIEIKKPFDDCIVSDGQYRNNHVPRRDLSGAIIQIEKYAYYLLQGGSELCHRIQKAKSDQIPKGIQIQIVNPRAIIIMGRSNNLNSTQIADFEIIKRQYKTIADILTYDDLLKRLITLRDALQE